VSRLTRLWRVLTGAEDLGPVPAVETDDAAWLAFLADGGVSVDPAARLMADLAMVDLPPRRRPRLRLRRAMFPTPGIELAEVADPRCPVCRGEGGWEQNYQLADGHGGVETVLCDCWDPGRRWLLLRVPTRVGLRWWRHAGGVDQPPF